MLLLLLTVSLWAVEDDEAENQEPVVSNPIAKQLDYEYVLVTYDVEDADGDLMTVSIKVSDDGVKPVLGEKIVWEKDGSEMMRIPVGSFEMGDYFGEGSTNERPVHRVELDEFYMDSREVTNSQYGVFMDQTGYRKPKYWNNTKYNQTNQPVVGVDWNDAVAYAKWAGKRLPTEAEWEYAARGGLVGKRYPGGDEISHDDANYDRKVGKARVVGSYPANGYGLYDMAGNVYEWCQDWYSSDYYSSSPTQNPTGPDTGSRRVLRGGDWLNDTARLRVANRFNSNTPFRIIGPSTTAGFDVCQDRILPLAPPQEATLPAMKRLPLTRKFLYHWQGTKGL